ncbi:MAG: hypothetical protein NTW86_14945 [Candidatus Sumerlaeota bacterium]|nr:hypothetical protein [Candidatus Sumerlaeota bacterium]
MAYGYDLAGRMTGVDFSLASMTDLAIQYNAVGQATKMTGPGTTLSYTYSGIAPTSEYYDSGVGFQFANNGAGLRLASETPAGEEFWNYYDSLGRLTLVWYGEGGGTNLATFQYDAATNRLMTRVSYDPASGAKHVEASYSYDGAGRLTRVGSQGYDSDGDAQDSCAISYTFNAAGNVTKAILDDNANSYLAYQYDALDRLTREERAGTAFDYLNEYWYDAGGNRTKLAYTHGGSTATTTYLYDDNYRLTKSTKDGTDTTYQWDAAGNLTHKATTGGEAWEYLWDARDKMTKVRKQPNGQQMADVAVRPSRCSCRGTFERLWNLRV